MKSRSRHGERELRAELAKANAVFVRKRNQVLRCPLGIFSVIVIGGIAAMFGLQHVAIFR